MYIFLNNKTSIWPFYKKECLFPVRLIQTGSVIKKGKKYFTRILIINSINMQNLTTIQSLFRELYKFKFKTLFKKIFRFLRSQKLPEYILYAISRDIFSFWISTLTQIKWDVPAP